MTATYVKASSRVHQKIQNMSCAQEIAERRIGGKSFEAIAKEFGLSKQTVYEYCIANHEKMYGEYLGERYHEILDLASDPKNALADIAEKVGISVSGLNCILSDSGFKRKLSQKEIRRMVSDGELVKRIAAYYGCSYATLHNFMNKHGIEKIYAS